jgi:hypothetical protein
MADIYLRLLMLMSHLLRQPDALALRTGSVLLAARLSRPSPPSQGQAARGRFASLDTAATAPRDGSYRLGRGRARARRSAQAGPRFAGPLAGH